MPIPFVAILIGVLGVGVAVALAFWPEIIKWAEESLFLWVEENLPEYAETVRLAFKVLDDVAVFIRQKVKAAWEKVRRWLLKETVEIELIDSSTYNKKVTSWIKRNVNGETKFIRRVTEEELGWDELPSEVREKFIREGRLPTIDVTELRDKEIAELQI